MPNREKKNVGILLVTHKKIGSELILAAEFILGMSLNLMSLSINQVKNMSLAKRKIKRAIEKLDTGLGVLILTDLFGATPFNLCQSLAESKKIEVMSGVNLPLLIKAISVRAQLSLEEIKVLLKKYSSQTIQ